MGLGLTSTKNIISSHNASIEVESTVKKGTSFILYFKLAE
jgi:signal transduction histidine kinase